MSLQVPSVTPIPTWTFQLRHEDSELNYINPWRILSELILTVTLTMDPLIVDVRENTSSNTSLSNTIVDAIIEGLSKPSGARSLTTLLLYNERGLRLYDDITTKATEYYLFGC